MKRKKLILLLGFLVILLVVVNYSFLDNALIKFFTGSKAVVVERIIDGDTIEFVSGKTSVRLLGINSPEKGEKYYEEASKFLEDLVLNKNVELKFGFERYDKYKRLLAYMFIDGKNVNLAMVENGFANYYFPSARGGNFNQFKSAWEECIRKNVNLCEKSDDVCSSCIMLNEGSIKNNCTFACNINNWEIKSEGRDKIVFDAVLSAGEEVFFVLELEKQDSLFLRDSNGMLVSWKDLEVH